MSPRPSALPCETGRRGRRGDKFGVSVNKAVSWLRKLNGALDILVKILAGSTIAVIFLFVFGGIVTRQAFGRSSTLLYEYPSMLLIALTFLLFGFLYRSKRHIAVDLISDRLKPGPAKILAMFIHVLVAYGSYLVLRGGIATTASFHATRLMTFSTPAFPMWILSSLAIIGAGLLLLSSIELLIADAVKLVSGKAKGESLE